MSRTLESAAAFLDESPLPHCHAEDIARRLCQHLGAKDWVEDAVLHLKEPGGPDLERARDVLWARIDAASEGGSARERLFLSASPGATPLDGYLLEFLIHWARQLGIPERDIEASVLDSLPPFA
jgi:hypothetical protein